MPTVPGPQVDLTTRNSKLPTGGNIARTELPRNQSLLNRNVAPTVIRGQTAEAQNLGGQEFQQTLGQTKALRDMAATFQRVTDQVQSDIDSAVTKQADNRLSDAIRETLMNPEAGYLTTVGKSSLDQRAFTADKINSAKHDIERSLQTDAQKIAFAQAADARIASANQKIDSHALQQVKIYKQAESKARITAAKTDAAASWGSWNELDRNGKQIGAYNMHKVAMMNEIKDQAEAQGFTPGTREYKDVVQNATLEQTTDLHMQVVQNMVSFGLSGEAKEYFKDAVKAGEVDPSSLDTVNDLIKTGSVKEDSLSLSFQLKGSASDQVKQLEQMFKSNSISAEVFDATKTRVEHNDSVRRAQVKEYESNVLGTGQEWVANNQGASIEDMPATLKNALITTDNWASVVSYHKTNGQPVTDTNTFVRLRMLAAENPEAFKDIDLKTVRGYLNDSDFKYFVNLQVALVENNDGAVQSTTIMKKTVTSIKADLQAVGIDTTPNSTKDAESLAEFQSVLFRSLDAAADDKGKELTEDEARQIGLDLIKDAHERNAWFFNSTKPAFQVTDEEIAEGDFVLLPISEMEAADINAIRERFPNASNHEVEKIYSTYLRSQ